MSASPGAGSVWQGLFEQISLLQAEVDSLSIDRPLDRAEGARYLARLLANGLTKFNGPAGPAIDYATPRIGGFNPDYLFGHARIDPCGRYRLRGKMNDVHRLSIGTYAGPLGVAQAIGHLSSDRIQRDPDGRFELDISDEAPTGSVSQAPQNWLAKSAGASSLMVRQLLLHASDRPAELTLERVDRPDAAGQGRLTVDKQRDKMDGVLLFVVGAAGRFFRWTRLISRISNSIEHIPAEIESEVKADPDTFYAIGYFDLAEDERLEVRVTPPNCDYWGLQTTNHWLEPIEDDARVCHRNHATSEADVDGSFTLSISSVEDSRRNSIHTLGHRNGAIFFRVVGAGVEQVALPVCTVHKR